MSTEATMLRWWFVAMSTTSCGIFNKVLRYYVCILLVWVKTFALRTFYRQQNWQNSLKLEKLGIDLENLTNVFSVRNCMVL